MDAINYSGEHLGTGSNCFQNWISSVAHETIMPVTAWLIRAVITSRTAFSECSFNANLIRSMKVRCLSEIALGIALRSASPLAVRTTERNTGAAEGRMGAFPLKR
jgi:hypothetical protein